MNEKSLLLKKIAEIPLEAKKRLLAEKLFASTKKKAAAEGVPFSLTVEYIMEILPKDVDLDEELLAIAAEESRHS